MDGTSSTPVFTDSPNTTVNGKVFKGEHSNVVLSTNVLAVEQKVHEFYPEHNNTSIK